MIGASSSAAAITVALDAMSGDYGPKVSVPAALRALETHPALHLILVGDTEVLQTQLQRASTAQKSRLSIQHASEIIGMGDLPKQAVRAKKDASMRVAIELVKAGKAKACVSAGNTGAIMMLAHFLLKPLPKIERPAIISTFPNIRGHTHVLDLGANATCSSLHLFQFAVMGSVLCRAVEGIPFPRVGLLNIGSEDIKGNDIVKQAATLLQKRPEIINYIGYVEGHDIFRDVADVIVCDGFIGNVVLKASEGLSKLIGQYTRDVFYRNLWTRIASLPARTLLQSVRSRVDPDRYNGASFIGLRGIVVKSHGGAGVKAFYYAIHEAFLEAESNIASQINEELEAVFTSGGSP